MNIAFTTLVSSAKPNGLRNYIISLIEALDLVESDIKIYIITNQEFLKFLTVKSQNIEIILVNIPHFPRWIMRPIYFFWQNTIYFWVKKKYNIQVFHSPNPAFFVFKPAEKFILTLHDLAENFGFRHKGSKRLLRLFFNWLSVKKADKVVTVSDFSKNQFIQIHPSAAHKIFVVKPALKLEGMDSNKSEIKKMDTPFFLHIGGAKSHKNLFKCIEAFKRFENLIDEEVALISIGNNKTENFRKLFSSEDIIIKGFVSETELRALYKQSIGLLYISYYEGFGFPILEAMRSGIPVITSNTSSMPEIAGDAALLVKPDDVDDIVNSMNSLYLNKSLRKSLVKKGYKNLGKFSQRKFATEMIKLYAN